jgi:predicted RecA/RadA family phage recombinase
MAQNFIQDGKVLEYTNAGSAIASGAAVVMNDLVGVALGSIANGATGQVATEGVFELTKETPLVISQGDKVYWDVANSRVDKTNTNKVLGVCAEDAGSAATTVKVKLVHF